MNLPKLLYVYHGMISDITIAVAINDDEMIIDTLDRCVAYWLYVNNTY